MSSFEKIEKEFKEVLKEGKALFNFLKEKKQFTEFGYDYQKWFSKAKLVIRFISSEREQEFLKYYSSQNEYDYPIQSYIEDKGVPSPFALYDETSQEKKDSEKVDMTKQNLTNQLQIFSSLESLLESSYHNLELSLFSDIESAELSEAIELIKINIRAAGALAGVVLESHLKHVAKKHKLDIDTNNSTISSINDKLKEKSIYGIAVWRKTQHLNDIRNLCSHKKKEEPTMEQVKELIDGTDSIVKQIF